ncbi:obscurin [Crotalus adamanteus]|uniref:Obscurin n=1 Tax=Crotalus adamanteus TaxID=8729 RepID=A0AAW1B2A0_CROAD
MQVPLEDVQVRCGEMAKFQATIEGHPQPVIGWFKGISLLLDSERIYQSKEGTSYSLILYNAQAEDGGVYTCMAKNAGGEVVCKAELVVHEDKKSQEVKKRSPRRKLHSFYEVKQEIGRGSFSVLKKVIHKANRVACAAKFIPLRSRTRERAYRERDILVELSHDRITQLLDQFETRKTLILVLELCSNEELLDRLHKKNMVTEAEVKFYIKQLLEGILYLHSNEILHLDIKPSNILMVHPDRDDLKICDFGFAQRINPSEPQYSTYGSPEFVPPEVLSRSPVSTASDIWPVGVISYLSLTCKSPFAGENDRATLLNVQNGIISWNNSDWGHLSKEAKDFIEKILQPAPRTRPSVMECLSHPWFSHKLPPEEAHFIETKSLSFFVSRSKWQRSLMSYKSLLVMRPIPEILEKHHKNTSLGISRQLVEESSSSSTSGSSSDNEILVSSGKKPFGPIPEVRLSVLEGSNDQEDEVFEDEFKLPEDSRPPIKTRRLKEPSAKGQLDGHPVREREISEIDAHGRILFELASLQDQAGLLPPEEGRMERSPGCVPRHSVIKSTFYSHPSENLTDFPSSPGKGQRKQLERAKRSYRKAGYSKSALTGLREPLLERFELGEEGGPLADVELGKGREGSYGPPIIKSASFDTAQKSPKVTFQVSARSRSLDDYRIRARSFAEEQDIAEEDMDTMPHGGPAEGTHLRDEKTSAAKTREGFSEEHPRLILLDDKERSKLGPEQDKKSLVLAQGSEKEDLAQKTKVPRLVGKSPQGRQDLILEARQSSFSSGLAPKSDIEEEQASMSSPHRDGGTIFPKGESSDLRAAPSEIPNLVSRDSKEEKLSHEITPSSPKSVEGRQPQQKESHHLLKAVPFHITQLQAEKQLAGVPDKSPKDLQTMAMHEGHPSLIYPGTQMVESRGLGDPILHADICAFSTLEDQQIPSQKPSGSRLAKSTMLEKKDLEKLDIPQTKMGIPSISESAKQKPLHQLPVAHLERKLPVSKGEGPVHPEMVTLRGSQHPSQRESPLYRRPSPTTPRSAAALIQASLQPEATSIPILHGETQMASLPKSSSYPEGESLLREVQRPPQAQADLMSFFEAEKYELYHHLPSVPDEVLKGQAPAVASYSQAKMRPFGTSGEKVPITLKKRPYSTGEGRSEDHKRYRDTEAQVLEDLAEEMAYRSKATTPWPESGPVSPQGEMVHQKSPSQAVRPKGRYLVRRGKREGGIGLADPSEADVIYPGEEDYFSLQAYLSKKARRSSPYEGQGLDYPGSSRMYEIALVQIQDLSEMPRPNSKTSKFDITEVEPAFLNFYELYDIVYSPFEFLSFRKAPENLPSKRPSDSKFPSQQEKTICLKEDDLPEVALKEETGALKVEVGLGPVVAPRIGKRSDSEGDLPTGSQYDVPSDPTRKRKSSLQSALGLFKPVVRSQSMEQVELSLRKRMKASVAQFSKMLTRKLSSEDTRTASEEVKSEQAERTSLTEPSPTSKKKKIFSAFTLPGLKTKDKGPSFVEELTDQTVAVGQSLTLSCRTSSHSFSGIGWFKDGAAICSTDRILISSTLKRFQLLTVLSATATDFGVYTCKATSSHGAVSTSCTIRKAEAPSNIPAPDILEVLEDGVQLAWEAVELNHPVTYTVLCKKDDGEWKTLASDIPACCYTVEHLPRGLVYSFRIACVSPAGVGPYSYPTPKVKIGEEDQAAFQAQEEENRMAAPPTHQTYAFQTEIKRGRFSIIKQCREKFSGNPLAAKIIPYQPEEKDAILQEYQILRKLHHANIGQLQGAYVSPRHLVLIVELCVGPELLHALAGRTSYSEVQVRDYLWQILSAVEYLHKQDILHLDLRSENMVIVEPNLLKLLDFGNAHFYSPDQILTVDGCTDYVETMASELVTEKGAVPQTDIWAIGVTAFIMLSAEYPISSEAACDFGRLVKRDKIRLNKCYAGLSGGAINFLQSTLSLNPWRRPTATECLQSSWLQETGLDEHQQATVTFSTTKLRNFVAERERKRVLLSSKYGVTAV